MADYQPIFRSPIAAIEAEPVTSGLRVQDLTGIPIVLIRGEAGEMLQSQFSKVPASPGDVVDTGEAYLARLRPAEFYLFGKSASVRLPAAPEIEDALPQAGLFAHAADAAHSRAVLRLAGAEAAEVLSKICGLDFHDTTFPTMQVKQTSAAKIKTLIARCDEKDEPTYYLHVNRPFGQYFWDILWDAGQEFGLKVGG